MESVDEEFADIHAVDDDAQALDGDVFVVGFGERALVEEHVGERPLFVGFFQEDVVTENDRGVAADENGAGDFVGAGLADDDRAGLVEGALERLGVGEAGGFGREAE